MTEHHLTKLSCSGSDGPYTSQCKSCPYSSVFLVEDFFKSSLFKLCFVAQVLTASYLKMDFFFHLDVEIWNSVEKVRRERSRSCTNSVISSEMPQQNRKLFLISLLAGTCTEIDCRNIGEIVSLRLGSGCPSTVFPYMFTLHYFSSSLKTSQEMCYYQHLDVGLP